MAGSKARAGRADGLARYRAMRDFKKTAEPRGGGPTPGGNSFVVQKHAARRLHYDFRLELDGTLKSWAVTRGPSFDPADKRLAVHVEDHPIDYAGFEGVIPQGEYGGGTVMVWDRGTWEPTEDPRQGYTKGKLKFVLHGDKLKGGWTLVRMGGRAQQERTDNWLLIKERDEEARPGRGDEVLEKQAKSDVTGRTMEQIAASADRVWTQSRRRHPRSHRSARRSRVLAAWRISCRRSCRPSSMRRRRVRNGCTRSSSMAIACCGASRTARRAS
jgi:bifunctional non-homologous end joining protein LigD